MMNPTDDQKTFTNSKPNKKGVLAALSLMTGASAVSFAVMAFAFVEQVTI